MEFVEVLEVEVLGIGHVVPVRTMHAVVGTLGSIIFHRYQASSIITHVNICSYCNLKNVCSFRFSFLFH